VTLDKRIEQILDKIVEIVFGLALTTSTMIVILECIGIFSRYLFRFPLNWVPGIVTLLVNWTVFLSIGVYFYRNQGIVISYFYEHFLPRKIQYIINFLVYLVIICFTFITAWQCWRIILTGDYLTTLSLMPIKYYWYSLPFFIGMSLGLLGSIKRLISREFN